MKKEPILTTQENQRYRKIRYRTVNYSTKSGKIHEVNVG